MIIARERFNIRLVAFRKAAHTSIINTFCTRSGEEVVRGANAAPVAFTDTLTASITVAFFRNPLARLVSAYEDLVNGAELYAGLAMWGYEHEMDFEDFIQLTVALPDKEIDLHLASQSYQLCEAFEEHHTDVIWIGQVEQLPAHWLEMQNFTALWDMPDTLPNFNARTHPPWPTYYTEALAHKALDTRYFDDYKTWQSRLWQ
jgi:hypothetical protein